MIDIPKILRLAGEGYDDMDIRKLTRTPVAVIRHICKDAGVKLGNVSAPPKPVVVVKHPQKDYQASYEVKQAAQYATPDREPPAPKLKPNPMAQARAWLGKRLVEKASGYWLDGVPVNLTTIMRETNKMLVVHGAEQITHDPKWTI